MKLGVAERLHLLNGILPEKGNYSNLKLLRKVREDLSFSEEENAKLQFENHDGLIRWDGSQAIEKDCIIGDTVKRIVIDRLREMDKKEELMALHMSLYEKFVGVPEEA